MKELPDRIDTVEQLEELLTRPSEALIDFIRDLDGDIMVLGASGKIGPTLTRMAKRAAEAAGVNKEIFAVARRPLPQMDAQGIKTINCDLLDPEAVAGLAQVENVVYMAGRKFGSTGNEWLTWAANAIVPYHVASVFRNSRIVVFSTGCVYPLVDVKTGGSVETDPLEPIGEYSMSCLCRERIFDYFSAEFGEKVVHIRLNYAIELRYGVPVDIALKVFNSQPVDVTTAFFNGIWQGDACDQILRCFPYASSPSCALNITGPEIISVRQVAKRFGELFGREPIFAGQETSMAYLSNASKANKLLGSPSVPFEKMIEWIADWVRNSRENLGKPTHFETQDGKF